MWIDRRLPALRRHPALGYVAAGGFVAIAVLLRVALWGLPPFSTFYPAILLSAFIGGRGPGILALVASMVLSWFLFLPAEGIGNLWSVLSLLAFALGGALIIFVVDLLDIAIGRLRAATSRLHLALRAADAGAWEWTPPDKVEWDETLFELLGLDSSKDKPSLELFLSRVHPADRPKMKESGELMRLGADPPSRDEYRIIRQDGSTAWLENHRIVTFDGTRHIIGITQDITRRKENEQRVVELMREVAHRVKNQYSVILAMIRETGKRTRSPAEFEAEIDSRIAALARSHDLLVNGEWVGARIHEVVTSQLEPFCSSERYKISGPSALLKPMAVQYLGMALHELSTNSSKHGALSIPTGTLEVSWSVTPGTPDGKRLLLRWQEFGGPAVVQSQSRGFGRQVLEHLAPTALGGTAKLSFLTEGVVWTLEADSALVN